MQLAEVDMHGRDLVRSARRYARRARSRCFLDRGGPENAVLLSGMARSGTTWAAQVLNYDASHRILFEPFNPVHVRAARPFRYIQYMEPGSRAEPQTTAARHIIAGGVRGAWVDAENTGYVFRQRIIKDVRTNLMLRWLADISPQTPIVLLIRHPLSVAASWLQLGWGGAAADERSSDFEVILDQPELLAAFPVIDRVACRIDRHDPLQRIVFQWCVLNLVPLRQFEAGSLTTIFYEDLVLSPKHEIQKLFRSIGRTCDWNRVAAVAREPSATAKSHNIESRQLVTGWLNVLTPEQVRAAAGIVEMFGLDHLYLMDAAPTRSSHPLSPPGTQGAL